MEENTFRLEDITPRIRARVPIKRADCLEGPNSFRPCPWVRCKWHALWLFKEPWLWVEKSGKPDDDRLIRFMRRLAATCVLDVADDGGKTLDEIGAVMRVTRERVRQIIDGPSRRDRSLYGRYGGIPRIRASKKRWKPLKEFWDSDPNPWDGRTTRTEEI